MGTVAVLGIYAAGYMRTEAAALQMERDLAARRLASALPVEPRLDPASLRGATRSAAVQNGGGMATDDPLASAPIEPGASTDAIADPAPAGPTRRASEAAIQESAPTVTAAEPASAPPAEPVVPRSPYLDGVFKARGWETRHGQIEAAVEIVDGRITSASVVYCGMRWSCSDVNELMAKVPQMQTPRVGVVSGASQTSEAFTSAVATAISYSMAARIGVVRTEAASE